MMAHLIIKLWYDGSSSNKTGRCAKILNLDTPPLSSGLGLHYS